MRPIYSTESFVESVSCFVDCSRLLPNPCMLVFMYPCMVWWQAAKSCVLCGKWSSQGKKRVEINNCQRAESFIVFLSQQSTCTAWQAYVYPCTLHYWAIINPFFYQPMLHVFRHGLSITLPTNDAHVASWILHKPIGIYMGDLILGVVLQCLVSASFSCLSWLVKG